MSETSAPQGRLDVVATPIGNLGDLSSRAIDTLRHADVILCEDTRRTRALLSAADIRARGRLWSLHAHNEHGAIEGVLARLRSGDRVALCSDAGMPGVSDPGGALIAAVIAEGFVLSVVPGASAVLAALVLSGFSLDRFCFEGFLARKGKNRRRALDALRHEERTTVIFESPARLEATLVEMSEVLGEKRQVAVCRELTKMHEEVVRGTLAEVAGHFGHGEVRGEIVVVLEGAIRDEIVVDADAALREALRSGERLSVIAASLSSELGISRQELYDRARQLRDEMRESPPT